MTDQDLNEQVARKLGTCLKHFLPTTGNEGNESHRHCDVPDYCHSIEAAWEILHEYRDFMIAQGTKGWTASFGYGKENAVFASADTAPRAIVDAFLKLP